jgi:hypothetical protein
MEGLAKEKEKERKKKEEEKKEKRKEENNIFTGLSLRFSNIATALKSNLDMDGRN